jgi:uncharacterized protein YaiL (DUF2058 family)
VAGPQANRLSGTPQHSGSAKNRNRPTGRARDEDRKRRQLNDDIRKIVERYRLNREDAEVVRNFLFKGRIRKIYVTPDQLNALNAGELGIACLTGGYHLLAPEHLEAIRGLSPDHVPDLDSGSDDDGEFPVPDDLNW